MGSQIPACAEAGRFAIPAHVALGTGVDATPGREAQDGDGADVAGRGAIGRIAYWLNSRTGASRFGGLMRHPRLYLLIVLALGAWLRFQGLDWGQGYSFQPDEKRVIDFAHRLEPPFDPYTLGHYPYGSLPLYLYRFTGEGLEWLSGDASWTGEWALTIVARFYAASFSTLTIVLVYALGKWRAGRWAGVLVAGAAAVSMLAIQYAHYGVTDSLLTLLITAVAFLSTRILDRGQFSDYVLAGLFTGLACASKTIGLVFVVIPWTAHVLRGTGQPRPLRFVLVGQMPKVLALGFTLVATVMIASPYYFFDFPSFHKALTLASRNLVSGEGNPTWTWQFTGTRPYLYQWEQLVRWALGLPLGISASVGILYMLLGNGNRERAIKNIVLLAGPTLYFLITGAWHAKFIRYLLPMIPFLCTFAGIALWEAGHKAEQAWLRRGTVALIAAVGTLSLLYAVAFVQIYRSPDTRIRASQWIVDHLGPGTPILHDPEPNLRLPLDAQSDYDIRVLDYYAGERLQEASYFVDCLQGRQTIVVVSRRNYATVMRLADRYPVAACYYKALFDGALGFRLVREFVSYPHIGPWQIKTDSAEETFQVFDHPRVLLFERAEDVPLQQLYAALACSPDLEAVRGP